MTTAGWTIDTSAVFDACTRAEDEIAPLATFALSSQNICQETIAALTAIRPSQAAAHLGPAQDAVTKFFDQRQTENLYQYVTNAAAIAKELCDTYATADALMAEQTRQTQMRAILFELNVGIRTGSFGEPR